MAAKYAAQYSKTQEVPARLMDDAQSGNVRFINDTFTLTADLSTGDTIAFGKIPAGAKVLDCIVTWTDLDAAGGTINVGYTGTATAFHSALDVTNAGSARFAGATVGVSTVANEVEILVAIAGDTDATTGTIQLTLVFILN